MRVWRICLRRLAATACDGNGARIAGGRWSPKGLPVVYTASSLALAAMELFVHLEIEYAGHLFVALPIDVPDDLPLTHVSAQALPPDWREQPAPVALQATGETWFRNGTTVGLVVPSAVVPPENNLLLNPSHRDFGRIVIHEAEAFNFDERLWKK